MNGNRNVGQDRVERDDDRHDRECHVPVEAINTLQFQNNISYGGPSVYRVIQNENRF